MDIPLQRAGLREDADAGCIFGVDSEIDDLPLGDARSQWNEEALAEKDAEAAEYRARVRDGVIDACRSLEQKLTRAK